MTILKIIKIFFCFRYVKYFANLLMGITKVNPTPIILQQITFSRLFVGRYVIIKIYEKMKPIYTSHSM